MGGRAAAQTLIHHHLKPHPPMVALFMAPITATMRSIYCYAEPLASQSRILTRCIIFVFRIARICMLSGYSTSSDRMQHASIGTHSYPCAKEAMNTSADDQRVAKFTAIIQPEYYLKCSHYSVPPPYPNSLFWGCWLYPWPPLPTTNVNMTIKWTGRVIFSNLHNKNNNHMNG